MSSSAAVLALPFLRARVFQHLKELAAATPFYRFEVDPQTGNVLSQQSAEYLAVPKVNVDETSAPFGPSAGKRGDYFRDRGAHQFSLVLEFDVNAMVDGFEEALCAAAGAVIPASSAFPKQITLLLVAASYTHPPLQGSASGTSARFQISALVTHH